ncbi:hypothetical protein OSB04_018201 [Centaurea solstitialis]|uniref:non-specific serine/threonine protein kinase n=1 Tax=Centaurea solstitialis TaxID=347529 RepID=A0AA38TF96_9ASTR|nr:hypothetical protein OSB04_018201 [Centaurea solstitialis]
MGIHSSSIFLLLSTALFLPSTSTALDTISANQTLKDGNTIVSSGGMFELGFFSLRNSKNRYLGIWYKKISVFTVVWVANRKTPITDTSAGFKVNANGNLMVLGGGNTLMWSSNSTVSDRNLNPVAQLLETGNLVVWDTSSTKRRLLWQSFDYFGDTFLPGMKNGKDLVTGREKCSISWKSPDDPSPGRYLVWVDTNGYPQIKRSEGRVLLSRLGPWNGVGFSGLPNDVPNPIYTHEFVVNQKEIYFRYQLISSVVQRIHFTSDGKTLQMHWIERTQEWVVYADIDSDNCGRYAICGPYGSCNVNKRPPCSCIKGFEPKIPEEWKESDWSSGCQRKKPLSCVSVDGFRRISGVKFPDTQRSWYNLSMTLGECETACRKNCNCTAYANLDIRNGGSGCLLWFDKLMDIREYDADQDLYIRIAASELAKAHKWNGVLTIVLLTSSAVLLLFAVAYACRKKNKKRQMKIKGSNLDKKNSRMQMEDLDELPFFSLREVAKATDNFCINNKIGEGGFGPVYKGVLDDGRDVAVKRLSETSQQGLDEFKNEVICIAKLQHRNLVKLLGYCTHGNELILIYEYMANKSLDSFLFDETKCLVLDWPQRFHIIHGMARGILYLHQDSRLQIIHRDLKAGNILLDADMNPKISDFGLARMFIGFDNAAKTKKVVGTYGYISPEYAVHGRFSTKSDVFSFGVLVLEIVSGMKNREFAHEDHRDNLLGHPLASPKYPSTSQAHITFHEKQKDPFVITITPSLNLSSAPLLPPSLALVLPPSPATPCVKWVSSSNISTPSAWRLYKEERSIELMSSLLCNSCIESEVVRAIHVGLLCVQHNAEDRPTMLSVVLMLVSEGVLPQPRQPAFFTGDKESYRELDADASVDAITQLKSTNHARVHGMLKPKYLRKAKEVNVEIGKLHSSDLSSTQNTGMEIHSNSIFLFFSTALFFLLSSSTAVDTISTNQTIKDGNTIVSQGGMFELGFFSLGKSKNRYLGIWYKKISVFTVVWVANREKPITGASGGFKVSGDGSLMVLSGGNIVTWSSNSTVSDQNLNPVAQLLETGNLVVWDTSSTNKSLIWQSFDNSGDTLLPGMKFGKDLETGRERYFTPWKSPDDPSPGRYLVWLNTNGYPQIFRSEGGFFQARIGPWNGLGFSGLPIDVPNPIYSIEFAINQKEIYFRYDLLSSVVQRIHFTWDGKTLQKQWIERTQEWVVYADVDADSCSRYAICGPYGSCNINKRPPCSCIKGFEPKIPEEWKASDWSSGCQRKKPLNCGSGDGFRKISGVKLPDTQKSWYNLSMTLGECEMACRNNCNCTAYTNIDIRNGGSGCLLWFHELRDIREYDVGQDLYIRLAASELAKAYKQNGVLTIVLLTASSVLLLFAVAYACRKKKKRLRLKEKGNWYGVDRNNQSVRMKDLDELPFFSLREVAKATDNFSINNKIGEGGFGPVYKGVLEDGKEVAVKRLSETSQQGVDEFKNEVICIAKLQHRNLVKLLGYCIHANELILIYEYMTNKSLDVFLFDETKCLMIDWPQRFHIIHGMARGILYLHQDSRLQIIHRDLKAGNILLDADMNPKISDFGLARKFIGFDNAEKTKKVVGTYGYISPEYAVHGRFSTKSDVFSFGVLVLEIVSGKKNRECSHGDHRDNLLGHAWRLYKEGRPIELMCASLHNSCIVTEVVRSIHVALLCVQHHAEDRPTMLSVVLMLVSEGVLPQPRQPAFFTGDNESYCELDTDASVDECTITQLSAAVDTISRNQKIKDGDTIVSDGEMFELGFFSPGKSKNRYLGIWYKKISKPTIVWVANRETPINDTSGIFQVSREGDLQILSAGNTLIWSSNSTVFVRNFNLKAQLLESGNLVLLDETSTKENPIWQSFDYLGDTLLPGMKIGKDLVTERERHSTSWKSPDDPCIGLYKIWMDTNGYPQIFQREGEALHARLGPWNGVGFDGFPIENPNPIYSVEFVVNEKEIYYRYELKSSVVQRIVVSWDGVLLRLNWIERIQEWVVDGNIMIVDSCGRYGGCGPYGMCSINMYPPCRCVEGFEPKFPKEWNATDWSGGCKHKQPLHCGSGDGFRKISGLNFPDTRHTRYNVSMTLEECEVACRKNCSCTAYANLEVDVYYGHRNAHGKKDTSVQIEDLDALPFFSLHEIAKATDNFSINNKIGEPQWGSLPVKAWCWGKTHPSSNPGGVLDDGRSVAVKRLSETSQQGLEEFKNEVVCIAKLQHRNLVKLLGYCIHGNELILIYEYMANKSLDSFLFDETRSSILNWPQRFHIIQGMARGILYLHQDSRLQIIHRDLKAGNVLLDGDMNPKISDFGLARMFVGSDATAKTKKVVGTYGYISPEYAVHGRFSTKLDVFSFGVLVLEIVSGKKNRGFCHDGHGDNFLGHAWRLYKGNRSIEIMSASLHNSCIISEVLRAIHVALLCVQHHAEDRPTMLSVVLMLVSEGALPPPKQPAFFTEEGFHEHDFVSSQDEYMITLVYAR